MSNLIYLFFLSFRILYPHCFLVVVRHSISHYHDSMVLRCQQVGGRDKHLLILSTLISSGGGGGGAVGYAGEEEEGL